VTTAVGIMARAPSAAGKTRLAPHLSAERLRALRSALLADTLHALQDVPGVVLFFTPDEAEHEFALVCDTAIPRVAQGSGDLGARMLNAIRHLLDTRKYDTHPAHPAALLVGTDIPWLAADHVREAADTLETGGGIVLGPADDGGYYLIGMTQAHAGLFEHIAWGTGRVLTDTLRAAERIGVEARLVRSTYDVDTIDDLRRLERDLQLAPAGACPHVRRWFSEA
jgi:rSAM/selenodomain-associated transferase 1